MKKILPLLILSLAPSAFAVFSVGEPALLWEKKTVSVCWADQSTWEESAATEGPLAPRAGDVLSWTDEQKQIISESANRNFTQEATAISFEGWKDCSETPEADVFLVRAHGDYADGSATVGDRGNVIVEQLGDNKFTFTMFKDPRFKRPFVMINTKVPEDLLVTPEQRLRLVSLHELGHIAGLRHEHARPEASEEIKCKIPELWFQEPLGLSARLVGDYDSHSIMSYCEVFDILKYNGLKKEIALTEGDRKTLRCLYANDCE